MSEATINLLMQIPLAGVVIFVVIVFLKHIEKTESATTEVFRDLTDQITKTNSLIYTHDEKTDAYLDGMKKAITTKREKTQAKA
jgi:hypothetical protein